ncbi:MAG TPA: MarC family protein [Chloroflexota bacterium]|nr:MarC family protein [Chloroflexota bacterium]
MAFFAAALVTIISVVDPIGMVPVVLVLTASATPAERVRIVRRSIVVAAVVLAAFAAGGQELLRALGISQAAFSIAGGILLLLIAIDMLFARQSRTKETPEEGEEALRSNDVSVFPLAIPMLAGPGAIATIIIYMSQAGTNAVKIAAVAAAVAISLLATYLAMSVGTVLFRLLGRTGIHVFSRVMGILLSALAVQFVLNGISVYYHHNLP